MSAFPKALWYARSCYGHFAGQLALEIFDAMIAHGYLTHRAREFRLTESGLEWMRRWAGVDTLALGEFHGKFCIDRTEHRAHVGGALGRWLLNTFIANGLLARTGLARQIVLTSAGERFLFGALAIRGRRTESD